ncbi:hypothetical protein MCAG_01403 [Micromonospora sp. ATCC 39149]|uniref:Amidohydrolase family protein n=1 Tax=Micromonospora carbonacea TaxID=47853 RepID=A0A7D6C9V3_9ACTN|nr:hypothetical protein [Micromonospora sp. ATCC 39149]EEP71076.1 hypothetical protein MCAG_01403 [Micromonospora sp. ATCC 39149]QLJ97402.1 hypothetical protein HZU44_21600 [Micromonospora carbonacea]
MQALLFAARNCPNIHVVYGRDSSWFPRGHVTRYLDDQLGICPELGLPDDHLRAIFAGNAERLLGLDTTTG